MIKLEESYVCTDRSGLGELTTDVEKLEDLYDIDLLDAIDDWLWEVRSCMEEIDDLGVRDRCGDEYQEIALEFLTDYVLPFIKEKGYVPYNVKDIPGAYDYVIDAEIDWKNELEEAQIESDVENGYGERDEWGDYSSYSAEYINGLSYSKW